MKICFLIPVYNEAPTLPELVAGIQAHADPWEHRILVVDDGSTDETPETLRKLHAEAGIDYIILARNMGKTRALAVGFARADGDIIVTMDGDLQDRPEEIPKLIGKYEEGYDFVCGWKARRKDAGHKVFLSRIYNAGLCKAFGLDLHDVNTGFKAIRADVAKRLPLFGDMHRMMAVYAAQAGYRVGEVAVTHAPRAHGSSRYGLGRYHRGAMDAALAWMLTRGESTPRVQRGGLAAGLVLLVVSAGLVYWGSYRILCPWLLGAGVGLACLGGALIAISRWVLPVGEYIRDGLSTRNYAGDIAEATGE